MKCNQPAEMTPTGIIRCGKPAVRFWKSLGSVVNFQIGVHPDEMEGYLSCACEEHVDHRFESDLVVWEEITREEAEILDVMQS